MSQGRIHYMQKFNMSCDTINVSHGNFGIQSIQSLQLETQQSGGGLSIMLQGLRQ